MNTQTQYDTEPYQNLKTPHNKKLRHPIPVPTTHKKKRQTKKNISDLLNQTLLIKNK